MFSLKRHLGSQGVPDDVIDGIRKTVATDDGILFDVQAEVGLFVGCVRTVSAHLFSHIGVALACIQCADEVAAAASVDFITTLPRDAFTQLV